MARKKAPQPDSSELRRRAEERLGEKGGTAPSPGKVNDQVVLLHELQVHQIELEMQNAELCQARDELEAALEKYTDLYDFAPVGYLTLDRKGTISAANLNGSALIGVERSRLIGRRFGQFVTEECRSAFADFLEKVFASQSKEACEVALLNEKNSPLTVRIEAVSAASEQECRIALIDMTEPNRVDNELKKLSAVLETRNSDLEKLNKELESFNYMAAHDLRQPLNNIFISAQAMELLSGNKLDEESKEYLQVIKKGTMNMSNLIGAFLRFSNSEHAVLQRKKVDLSDKARTVTAGLRLAAPERQVTFKIGEGLKVIGDPDLLLVVLENLIGNAWKYTGKMKQATIEFGAMAIDGKPTYYIRDDGPGFDMLEAENLFLPFKRLQGSEEFKGYGVGLATVERIIRRHGGKIWALAEPGKGATFFFTLG